MASEHDTPEAAAAPRRRGEILAAAERVFQAHGYAATTIEAVADAAGVAKGSVYNYFKSKRELFYEVLADVVRQAETETGGVLANARLSAQEKLSGLLDHWCQRTGYYQRYGRLLLEFWANAARDERRSELAGRLRQMYVYWHERMAALLRQGVAAGEFATGFDPDVAASMLMGLLDGIQIQSILDVGVSLDAAFLEEMKRTILAGLTASAAGAGDDRQNRGADHD